MTKKKEENEQIKSANTKKSTQDTKAKPEGKAVPSVKSPNAKDKKSKKVQEIVELKPVVDDSSKTSKKPKTATAKVEKPKVNFTNSEVNKVVPTPKSKPSKKVTPNNIEKKEEVAKKVEVLTQTKSLEVKSSQPSEKKQTKKSVPEIKPKQEPKEDTKKQAKPQASAAKSEPIQTSKKSVAIKSKEPAVAKTTPTPKPKISTTLKKNVPLTSAAQETIAVQENEPIAEVAPVRYSDEELEMFEKVITEAKRESFEELRMLKERLEDLNTYDLAEESMFYSMHMGEQGSEPMEKEKTYAQIQRINEYIKKLDEALQRIKNKTYGICRMCGILIAKERLLAVPITTLSASWKIHQRCPEDGIDRIEPFSN